MTDRSNHPGNLFPYSCRPPWCSVLLGVVFCCPTSSNSAFLPAAFFCRWRGLYLMLQRQFVAAAQVHGYSARSTCLESCLADHAGQQRR